MRLHGRSSDERIKPAKDKLIAVGPSGGKVGNMTITPSRSTFFFRS